MAKGKNSKSGTRDALQSLTVTLRPGSKTTRLRHSPLNLIDDLRTFDFEPDSRPARSLSGRPASFSIEVGTPKKQSGRQYKNPFGRAQMAFTAPAESLVCVRRSRRKEVLFAKKKAGKRGQKKPRWSKWSSYKC